MNNHYLNSAPMTPPGTPSVKALSSPINLRIDISKITNFGPVDGPLTPPLLESPFSPAWGGLGRRDSESSSTDRASLLSKVGRRLSEMSPHRRLSTSSAVSSMDGLDEYTETEATKGHAALPLTRAPPHVPRALSIQTWRSGQHALTKVSKKNNVKNRLIWALFALGSMLFLRTYLGLGMTGGKTVINLKGVEGKVGTGREVEMGWTVEKDTQAAPAVQASIDHTLPQVPDEEVVDKLKTMKGANKKRRLSYEENGKLL